MDDQETVPLASIADLATLTGKDASDGKLVLALSRASARFRGAVRHPVTHVDGDETYLSGDGSSTLLLPAAPVDRHTLTVEIDGQPVTDYQVAAASGILRRKRGWPDGLDNVKVTYSHGYRVVPADISDAVLEQAELQYQILAGVQQVTQGGRSVSFGVTASVGVTQRWSDAVERYALRGDRT